MTPDFDASVILKALDFAWVVLSAPVIFLWAQVEKIKADQRKMKDDYYETSIHATKTYVDKADYREDLKNIHTEISNIGAKIDSLAVMLGNKEDRK